MRAFLPPDSIVRRMAITVMLAMLAASLQYALFASLAGVWARPPLNKAGLFEQSAVVTRMLSAAPVPLRPQLAAAAGNRVFAAHWTPVMRPLLDRDETIAVRDLMRRLLDRPDCAVLLFKSPSASASARRDAVFGSAQFGMAVSLPDGSWVVFTLPHRSWGLTPWPRDCLIALFTLLSTLGISVLAARSLVRPIEGFATAARRFGADPNAPPMEESGPRELRAAIVAFNAMQTQIRRFVVDRTDMLAAISHDLRTPLTRVRLRGEFIDDPEQQRRLFRDVEEMQAMIDAALALFQDQATEESSTDFDLSELVRVIVDDLSDQAKPVAFEGADHVIYCGRPFALKRALENVIGNACLYGGATSIEVQARQSCTVICVRDEGPGIPEPLLETVFSPFYRVERSRNRQTGGVGLGLTSTRAIIRAHGGEITLSNRLVSGLTATIILPPAVTVTAEDDRRGAASS